MMIPKCVNSELFSVIELQRCITKKPSTFTGHCRAIYACNIEALLSCLPCKTQSKPANYNPICISASLFKNVEKCGLTLQCKFVVIKFTVRAIHSIPIKLLN